MTLCSFQSSQAERSNASKSTPQVLVRNTVYNLLTQGFLVILAVWSLPVLVHELSKEAFGLLMLVWTFVGYFTLLDFGISRASTKFLAEALALRDVNEIRRVVWTSISLSTMLGIITAGAVVAATPLLVHGVFKIDAAFAQESTATFMLAAAGIPFMLAFGVVKGFQMALQRFDLVNIFQTIMGIFQWVGSVVLLWLGFGLWEIILLTVGVRIALSVISLFQLSYLIPGIWKSIRFLDIAACKKFFSFGGWLTISQIISPLFLYLDRILIGALLSVSAIAYYAVPQEALTRLLIIPMSLTTTLFP